MASTHQAHIPLQNLSSQAIHAEIFPNLHSSLISITQVCYNEWIVTFDKHKFIETKNKDIIFEGYRYPEIGLWRFSLHHPVHNNKQANMLEPHLCKHIRPMVARYPRAYFPTSQQDFAIFYHQILYCPTKRTLLQIIKNVFFATWLVLTEKLISNYLPES